jgi:hypothetical protein
MSNGRDFSQIVDAARALYINLKTDIDKSKDRMEHVRLTVLAQEAHNLLTDLRTFGVGLVYTHGAVTEEDFQRAIEYQQEDAGQPFDEPLDLPEFRSPFDPRNL